MGDFNTFDKDDLKYIPKDSKKLRDKIPDLYDELNFVLQDMKRAEVVEFLKSKGFVNGMSNFQPTMPTKLFPGNFEYPFLRVDYLFHTKDIKIIKAQVLRDDFLNYTSDHFPIKFEVQF